MLPVIEHAVNALTDERMGAGDRRAAAADVAAAHRRAHSRRRAGAARHRGRFGGDRRRAAPPSVARLRDADRRGTGSSRFCRRGRGLRGGRTRVRRSCATAPPTSSGRRTLRDTRQHLRRPLPSAGRSRRTSRSRSTRRTTGTRPSGGWRARHARDDRRGRRSAGRRAQPRREGVAPRRRCFRSAASGSRAGPIGCGEQAAAFGEEWQVERDIAAVARGRGPIIAGPWLSEVGFEVLYWIPFLRWFEDRYRIDPERVIAVSRGGVAGWYGDLAARYVEIFDHLSPRSSGAATASGISARSRAGRSRRRSGRSTTTLIAAARAATASGMRAICHPSLMYRLFSRFWYGNRALDLVTSHTRYIPAAARRTRTSHRPIWSSRTLHRREVLYGRCAARHAGGARRAA